MLNVGLTGGIGSGKSTVAGRLAEHGAHVIDSDKIAREVVEPGTSGLAELVTAFGDGILAADGTLNRPALAAIAFADAESRARLNAIVHPKVGQRTMELIAQAPEDAVIVHDIPLLVENGLAPGYHLVVIVDAPVEVRVHRLVHSRGLSEQDARARIAAQATEAARRAVADVWLDNGGTPDLVLAEVDALWADRLVRFEANVRHHRVSSRGLPKVVPADPTWPAQAARVIARLHVVLGVLATKIEHVGPTSVPGLPAVNVLDIEITTENPAEVGALLAQAGFPATGPNTHAGADPDRWTDITIHTP